VVHNFALGHGDYSDFITLEEDELEGSEDNTIRGINEHINEQDGNLGKTMRDQIHMKIWEDRL
jgi:hypothetical protein